MNLQLERKRQDRKEDLLSAITLFDRLKDARLTNADAFRHNPKEHTYWIHRADIANRAAKRLFKIYQNT